MKKIFTLLTSLFLVTAITLPNQTSAQSCPWLKKAGGTNDESNSGVTTDASGNVYYVGYYTSANVTFGTTTLQSPTGYAQMYLAKYDSCGTFKWAKSGGGTTNNTYVNGVATDAAGNVYVAGYFNCDTAFFGSKYLVRSSYRDVFLVKYNPTGGVIWAKQGTGNDQDVCYGISIGALNDVYITGAFVSTTLTFGSNSVTNGTDNGSTYDVFVAKFDTAGTNAWVKGSTSHSSPSGYAFGYSVSSDASGNVYVGGQYEAPYIRFGADSIANNGYYDLFLVKYDANGNYQWLKSAGDGDEDGINGVASDAAGNVYVTGFIGGSSTVVFDGTHTLTNTYYNKAVFIAQYSTTGNLNWVKGTKGDLYSNNYANAIALDASGNAYITGAYSADSLKFGPVAVYNTTYMSIPSGTGYFMYDIFVAKYKSNGTLVWARTAGGDSTDIGYGIATGPHGALYLSGYYTSDVLTVAGYTVSQAVPSVGTGDAFLSNNIATLPMTANICLVSADTIVGNNEYNIVYWDKTPYPSASAFIIYREVSTNNYRKIGFVPSSSLSEFVDTVRSIGPANGDPQTGYYKYALQIMDTAGTYSQLGPYHETVFFVDIHTGAFTWNIYAVGNPTNTPVGNYFLMRDNLNNGTWVQVAAGSGTATTLNDPAYSTYSVTANWRVDGNGFNCTPTMRLGYNSAQSAIIKSKSNITNNRGGISVNQINASNVLSVYPNPAKDLFIVETNLPEKQNVQVVDVNGKIVLSTTITGSATVDASNLSEGVYTINIVNSNNVSNKRLVIVK